MRSEDGGAERCETLEMKLKAGQTYHTTGVPRGASSPEAGAMIGTALGPVGTLRRTRRVLEVARESEGV